MTEKKAKIRIVIYGTGAVGGVIGGLLALAGTPVVLIGRPGNVNAIRKQGLRIITPGMKSYYPAASSHHTRTNRIRAGLTLSAFV